MQLKHIASSTQEGWIILLIEDKYYKYQVDGAALFRFLEMLTWPDSNKGRALAYLKRAASSYKLLGKEVIK